MVSYLGLVGKLGRYKEGRVELEDIDFNTPSGRDLYDLFTLFHPAFGEVAYILSNSKRKYLNSSRNKDLQDKDSQDEANERLVQLLRALSSIDALSGNRTKTLSGWMHPVLEKLVELYETEEE